MQINKNELLKVISMVKPGLASKEIIEQATHLIFSNDEVVTFNDRICIMHPFPCEFSFSVKAEEFTKILNGIDEKDFELTLEDDCVKVKSASTKASLTTIIGEASKVEHLIAVLKEEIARESFWRPLPTEFLDGLYLCAFSANKDVATGVRSCIAIEGDNIISTDNIRASSYIMDAEMESMLIPAKEALELYKYPVTEFGVSENWIHFRTKDGIVFNCKSMKGDYPFKQVSKIFSDVEASIQFPAELKTAVESVVVLAEGDLEVNKMVNVKVGKTSITVKAEKERGWIEKSVKFENTNGEFSFIINPIFFAQILRHAAGFALIEGRAQFNSDNFYHVMALPKED